MSLRPLKHLRKTVSFRLTVWYSGIFILSFLLLFSLAYFLLSSSLNKQDKEAIQLKLKELSTLYQTGGIELLEREVSLEKKFEKKKSFFVRLAGPGNKTVFLLIPYQWAQFDIKELEKTTSNIDTTWIRLPAKNNRDVLEIASTRLPNDYLLQTGRSTEDREKIMRHFRDVFGAVMAPLILLGFVGGAFLGFRALKPIQNLIDTVRSVRIGRLDARVPSPQTRDELEELATLFNGMLEEIETLIRAMRSSLDNIAHDLRTPMTRLRGIAERALQSGQKAEACQEALVECIGESEQILTMLNALMDISEAETGVMKLEQEVVNIDSLMDRVFDLYRYVAEEKNIHVRLNVCDELCVRVDPTRMSQVLANLLDNAIKYTPHGGFIQLEAYGQENEVVITVQDNGMGIAQEELPRIWDRLYRGEQSRSQKGLGLGLSLVKAIVQAHKGRVDVSSEPGKGSIFNVYLPASD